MHRREFLFAGSAAIVATAVACTKNLAGPDPQVPIDLNRVGQLKYSFTSPADGSLYYDVFSRLPAAIATSEFKKDRVTGTSLNGYAVVSINGDCGPEMINTLGERTNVGWIIAVGNSHLFYNSIMDISVRKGDVIDFYYALPCPDPYRC